MKNNYTNNGALFAAIDIGSNSFHMIIARCHQGELRPIERIGEKVQLAAGMEAGQLSPDAMARGLACLRRLRQRLDAWPQLSLRAVATNAVRAAKNAREFIEPAEAILGCAIETIAGREEARLVYLGVAHSLADDADKRLVIDIGGGSTEIIVGERFQPQLTESLHMGCVSYLQYFPQGQITREGFQEAYNAAYREVLNVRGQYLGRWQKCIGASGTLLAIEQVLIKYEFSKSGIDHENLVPLLEMLLTFEHLDAVSFQGLKEDRRQVFASGLAITMALFDALNIERMSLSDGALREGVLYDQLGRLEHVDVREHSVQALERRYDVDTSRAKAIEEFALSIFDKVSEGWALQAHPDRRLLVWAARLHEIGLAVSHSHFHKHGEYLIRHADLAGFSRGEQEGLALLVRAHRRKFPANIYAKLDWPADSKRRLRCVAVILRLTILLKHLDPVEVLPQFEVTPVGGDGLLLAFPEGWLADKPLTAAELAQESDSLAAIGFGLRVLG
ncbi:Ppx/GppA family phosphatase [Dasania sp. GY-MA-18]|uniref:Ppx/GppA phosphatase family protein n=1 Tax=Dasania phycosphaerae TaxID=2950436 RepID=A0A9J6RJP4_9GAMM|nr:MULTISPECIES: Ppx/GppA phosphatase family protein [Dasania]MCR8922208.1 Ppx/GppA family phosphatase [Dasania sp. GY-MA-18]MCZ0864636.1 Ppx/GppA phosphatase family protein [Dasania phycosphaerae]MCZ0868364.1 Ppx/GppA phosphatase family protein [Dasania phycosphaerae]